MLSFWAPIRTLNQSQNPLGFGRSHFILGSGLEGLKGNRAVTLTHPGRSSLPNLQAEGRPAGPEWRWARTGWADSARSTGSVSASPPWRSRQGTALCSSHRTSHSCVQGPLYQKGIALKLRAQWISSFRRKDKAYIVSNPAARYFVQRIRVEQKLGQTFKGDSNLHASEKDSTFHYTTPHFQVA